MFILLIKANRATVRPVHTNNLAKTTRCEYERTHVCRKISCMHKSCFNQYQPFFERITQSMFVSATVNYMNIGCVIFFLLSCRLPKYLMSFGSELAIYCYRLKVNVLSKLLKQRSSKCQNAKFSRNLHIPTESPAAGDRARPLLPQGNHRTGFSSEQTKRSTLQVPYFKRRPQNQYR